MGGRGWLRRRADHTESLAVGVGYLVIIFAKTINGWDYGIDAAFYIEQIYRPSKSHPPVLYACQYSVPKQSIKQPIP